MPTKQVIQTAKPHTIKKCELITKYVESWAYKILGYKESKGLFYIDCMSNSGHYYVSNGNVIDGTAITVARVLNNVMNSFSTSNKRVTIYFNDKDGERISHLRESLASESLERVTIKFFVGDADDFLRNFIHSNHIGESSLLIYDPYQASIDWQAIDPFLNRWGEVIINHMFSDTQRGAIMAKTAIATNKYEMTYQLDIESLLITELNRERLDRIVEDIIIKQTQASSRHEFVATFPFFNSKNRILYNLVFCSKNIKGFLLFKKVAWKTFGGKSSLKNPQCNYGPLMFSGINNIQIDFSTDEECYSLTDIAKYINSIFCGHAGVQMDEIFSRLTLHPIFPSEGFKREILNILKTVYGVQCSGKHKSLLDFPS